MNSQQSPYHKIVELEHACRDAGIPLTVQRRLVLEALAPRTDHPTADQLFDLVREKAPNVSRTTVYRVLDKLVDLGVVRRISGQEARSRFDADTSRHHHMQCVRCGAVADYRNAALDGISVPTVEETGFEITDFSVSFNGICIRCRQRRAPR